MGNHVRGRAVVRDAPDPGAQRTAAIEPRETLPQRDLDILFEVAAQIGVGFIAARHAGEGGAEASDGVRKGAVLFAFVHRSEEHTSELQSLMRTSYAVFCLQKKKLRRTLIF